MQRDGRMRESVVHSLAKRWPTVQRVLPRKLLPYPTRAGVLYLDLGDSAMALRRVLRIYEPMKFANLERFLPPGGGFVDVGANYGDFTIWAARRGGPATRVLAVEADPDNAAALKRNVARNRVDGQVEIVPVAASTGDGTIELLQGHQSGMSTIVENELHTLPHMTPRGRVSVPTRRLDDLIAASDLHRIDVVKIDVEGAEELVLAGATDLLGNGKPMTLLIDLHFGVDVPALVSGLQVRGFTIRLESAPDTILETVPDKTLSIVATRP